MDAIFAVAPASPNAEEARTALIFISVLAAVVVVALHLALIVAVVRFRERRGRAARQPGNGRWRLQLGAAGVAGAIAAIAYTGGVVFTERAREAEPAVQVKASGQRWLWRYEYLDEGEQGGSLFSYHELVVPVDATVLLEVSSTDVIHGWQVPALGGSTWAVPGTTNRTSFKADSEGVYEGRSTVYSGPGYSAMRTRVRAVDPVSYRRWLRTQRRAIEEGQVAVRTALEAQATGGGAAEGGAS